MARKGWSPSTPHPGTLPRRHMREEADAAGFAPSRDDLLPLAEHLRAPEGTDCLAVFAAQVEAAREANERTWPK